MSVTTFGDLLTEAEQVLIALAGQREPDPPGLAAAWPDFSRRAVHAISAAAGARDPRWYTVDRLIVEVARAAGRAPRGPAVSPLPMDPLQERAGVLLGAAGDVLGSAPRDFGADPMLADANVQAAQSRVAALLAAAARTGLRALGRYDGRRTLTREASRDLATSLIRVEQLATAVFQSSPTIAGRADDVAVLSVQPGRLPLEDAIEMWGRQARDTVRCPSPSTRDLQAVAADLSRVATHSRVIVRAAVAYNLVDPDRGRAVEQALARVAAGWLDVAHAWAGFHTAQPPTLSKIAASHSLGQALMATTRHGRDWAQPNMGGGAHRPEPGLGGTTQSPGRWRGRRRSPTTDRDPTSRLGPALRARRVQGAVPRTPPRQNPRRARHSGPHGHRCPLTRHELATVAPADRWGAVAPAHPGRTHANPPPRLSQAASVRRHSAQLDAPDARSARPLIADERPYR